MFTLNVAKSTNYFLYIMNRFHRLRLSLILMLEQELKESIYFNTSSLLVSCRNCRDHYTLLFLCHLNSSFLGGSWWVWTLIEILPILDVLYSFMFVAAVLNQLANSRLIAVILKKDSFYISYHQYEKLF